MHEQEYSWYIVGWTRMGITPIPPEGFAERWHEFEAHASLLKESEERETLEALDASQRQEMQRRFQKEDFVRALLIGMAETNDT